MVLVAALAMQLIVLFCNQPTCIKNIKSITCSGDPHKKHSIKYLIMKVRKRSFAIFRWVATLY